MDINDTADRPARFKLAREAVAETLRAQIVNGQLPGGQPLRQDQIARECGVSAIPVREALRDLGSEGFVEFMPRRGAAVARLSRDEVIEICEMRETLEILALEKAMPRMRDSALRQARAVLARADRQSDTDLLSSWGAVNWAFHSELYQPADRPRLMRILKNLHDRFDRYLRLHFSALEYRAQGQSEHWSLLRYCENQDITGATDMLRTHIRTVHLMLVEYIDNQPVQADAV